MCDRSMSDTVKDLWNENKHKPWVKRYLRENGAVTIAERPDLVDFWNQRHDPNELILKQHTFHLRTYYTDYRELAVFVIECNGKIVDRWTETTDP